MRSGIVATLRLARYTPGLLLGMDAMQRTQGYEAPLPLPVEMQGALERQQLAAQNAPVLADLAAEPGERRAMAEADQLAGDRVHVPRAEYARGDPARQAALDQLSSTASLAERLHVPVYNAQGNVVGRRLEEDAEVRRRVHNGFDLFMNETGIFIQQPEDEPEHMSARASAVGSAAQSVASSLMSSRAVVGMRSRAQREPDVTTSLYGEPIAERPTWEQQFAVELQQAARQHVGELQVAAQQRQFAEAYGLPPARPATGAPPPMVPADPNWEPTDEPDVPPPAAAEGQASEMVPPATSEHTPRTLERGATAPRNPAVQETRGVAGPYARAMAKQRADWDRRARQRRGAGDVISELATYNNPQPGDDRMMVQVDQLATTARREGRQPAWTPWMELRLNEREQIRNAQFRRWRGVDLSFLDEQVRLAVFRDQATDVNAIRMITHRSGAPAEPDYDQPYEYYIKFVSPNHVAMPPARACMRRGGLHPYAGCYPDPATGWNKFAVFEYRCWTCNDALMKTPRPGTKVADWGDSRKHMRGCPLVNKGCNKCFPWHPGETTQHSLFCPFNRWNYDVMVWRVTKGYSAYGAGGQNLDAMIPRLADATNRTFTDMGSMQAPYLGYDLNNSPIRGQ